MKELKAFIYCRVLSQQAKRLLLYQENILVERATNEGCSIFTIAKVVGSGRHFGYDGMQLLIHCIKNKKINIIYVYDRTRINIYPELYSEFKMLCDSYGIRIVSINDIVD